GSAALAQRVEVSPQAIVVNPLPSFDVDVWVDRAPGRDGLPTYAVGEPITVGVRASESGYVYLFSVSSTGEVVQILPNRFDGGATRSSRPARRATSRPRERATRTPSPPPAG